MADLFRPIIGIENRTPQEVLDILCDRFRAALVATPPPEAAQEPVAAKPRFPVTEGQTPLNDKLDHRFLDVFREGEKARDSGTASPYHGHSLEHCLHAAGWVQRDLRLALDKAKADLALYAAPATGWRTMESAPKDGTQFLISGGTFYYDGSDGPGLPFNGVCIAHWDRLKSEWNGGYGSEYNGEYWHTPEGWMPLPPPLHAEGE